MNLTISTTYQPATDLGFLLMKHPDNIHEKKTSFGRAILFYPEASEERCTAAIMLEVDALNLIRKGKGQPNSLFTHYITDRPYAVTSFMSTALSQLLSTAMNGTSRARQELADQAIPLEASLSPLPCRGGTGMLENLFAPLGYEVEASPIELDPEHPDWGNSIYHKVTLRQTIRLRELLTHLYVLIPVLDNHKHYWVGEDEIAKLLTKGEGWLDQHPQKELIARRYLKNRISLARQALYQLQAPDEPEEDPATGLRESGEDKLEKPLRLNDQRMEKVAETVKRLGSGYVVDLGCGEGKLISQLLKDPSATRIFGIDVSHVSLERAARRLKLERMTPRQKERVSLAQGSLVYVDPRLEGFDVATCIEVIEHMDESRLQAFEQVLFAYARPHHVILSTPNREYNQLFEAMPQDKLRHPDHRFEWTRTEFQHWCQSVAERNSYQVAYEDIGEAHPEFGPPTQMAVFSKGEGV